MINFGFFRKRIEILDVFKGFLLAIFILMPMTAFSQDNNGEVQFYVFSRNGLPLQGVRVLYNQGNLATTDTSGYMAIKHPPGSYTFELTYKNKTVAFADIQVRQNQAVEVLLTVDPAAEVVRENKALAEAEGLRENRPQLDESLPGGTLTGEVTHIESKEKVSGATVIFRGVDLEVQTDDKGLFQVDLPEGTYALSVIHPDYTTRTVSEIEINPGKGENITVSLTPSAITLDAVRSFASTEVRVQGGVATLIEESKNSGVMLNFLGSEQISKTGDSDAAAALKRVTGLTVVDGRYVYVRGMGERYSASYLNDARIPSPEMGKRVVPLDLFPTSVIEALAIQKTYSPELYSEFGGGAVGLRTTGIPNDRYKRRLRQIYSFSMGYDADSSLSQDILPPGGTLDFLGIDDGGRRLPGSVGDTYVQVRPLFGGEGYDTQDEVNAIGKQMPPFIVPQSGTVPLDYSGSATIRDKVDFNNGHSFGWNISSLYKNDWSTGEDSITDYEYVVDLDGTVLRRDLRINYDTQSTTHNVDLGVLLNMEYKWGPGTNLESTTMMLRTSKNKFSRYEGFKKDDGTLRGTSVSWVEEMLLNQQLGGQISLPIWNQATLDWRYSLSQATHYEPNNQKWIYENSEQGFFLRDNPSPTQVWSDVDDQIHDAMIKLELPVFLFGRSTADYLEWGGQYIRQERTSDVRRFLYDVNSAFTEDVDEVVTAENINNGDIGFTELTFNSDSYIGTHDVWGGFFNTDLILMGNTRLNAGMRFESSTQRIQTVAFSKTSITTPIDNSFPTMNILPSINLTIPWGDKHQFRMALSQTTNRPDLNELSNSPTPGVEGGSVLIGNPLVEEAKIWNGDVRWEYYLAETENLSLGGFYKYFLNPIEEVFLPSNDRIQTITNIASAQNLGAELEWSLSLRYISDLLRLLVMKTRPKPSTRRLIGGISGIFRDMTTSGNVSIISSRVDIEEGQTAYYSGQNIEVKNTSKERPLQGQSPWVINASLGYKNKVSWSVDRKTHTSVNLNYNVFGPRIIKVGTEGTPDTYEQPFHQLDLVIKHSFNEVFSIGIKGKNLLDLPAVSTLDQEVISEEYKGRSFSLSAKFDL